MAYDTTIDTKILGRTAIHMYSLKLKNELASFHLRKDAPESLVMEMRTLSLLRVENGQAKPSWHERKNNFFLAGMNAVRESSLWTVTLQHACSVQQPGGTTI